MRFLIIPNTLHGPAHGEAFDEAQFTAYMRYNEELQRAGVLVASEGLNPNGQSAHVRMTDGKRTVIDGPYAETKELIAGFYLIEVDSKEQAIEWALRYPMVPGTDEVLEIRPLTGAGDIPAELVELAAKAAPTWASTWKSQR